MLPACANDAPKGTKNWTNCEPEDRVTDTGKWTHHTDFNPLDSRIFDFSTISFSSSRAKVTPMIGAAT